MSLMAAALIVVIGGGVGVIGYGLGYTDGRRDALLEWSRWMQKAGLGLPKPHSPNSAVQSDTPTGDADV